MYRVGSPGFQVTSVVGSYKSQQSLVLALVYGHNVCGMVLILGSRSASLRARTVAYKYKTFPVTVKMATLWSSFSPDDHP